MSPVIISGFGSYLPKTKLTNQDLESLIVDFDESRGRTLAEFIKEKMGIISRYEMNEVSTSGAGLMAAHASKAALEDAKIGAESIEMLVVCSCTGDFISPNLAAYVQSLIGLPRGRMTIHLHEECSGFVKALIVATAMFQANNHKLALVVASEAARSVVQKDRLFYSPLFGDAAGAVVLSNRNDLPSRYGVQATYFGSDGYKGNVLFMPRNGHLTMDHKGVFEFAVEKMVESTLKVLDMAGNSLDDVSWLVPHQAGKNIIEVGTERLGIQRERVVTNFKTVGNTISASIPIALYQLYSEGKLKRDDLIVMVGMGGGLGWGAVLYRHY